MTAFPDRAPTSLHLAIVVGAALAFAQICGIAWAETAGKPRVLIPTIPDKSPTDTPAADAAATETPAPPQVDTEAAKSAPAESGGAVQTGIQVGALRAVDPSAVGLLHEGGGGLGTRMWAGTSRLLVERLLPRLVMPAPSPTMQDLARRLLLSAADTPVGATAVEPAATSLLALRIERLAAAGDNDAVTELLRAASVRFDNPAQARIEIDARWLGGDFTGACELAREMLRRDSDSYWLMAETFCRALDQQTEAAVLAADLLREEGIEDEAFFVLVRALADDPDAELESLPAATPLQLAMLRAARRAIPPDATDAADPGVLRAIAGSPNATLDMRLTAAERAEAAGVLSPVTLGQIYASVPFAPEERANALSTAEADPGSRGAALLHQVAQIESVPAARAEALKLAWRLAREGGKFFTSARVNLAVTQMMAPTPEMVWITADLGRALLAAGDVDGARAWYDMARQQAASYDPEARAAVNTLWPLMQLADTAGTLPWDPNRAVAWWESTAELPAEQRIERATLLFTLFDALGYRLPAANWAPLYDGPLRRAAAVPSSALWHGLIRAAEAGRVGETVLFALLALGEAGTDGAEPTTLGAVVAALRSVGLERDARRLAVEAALARGF